MDNTNKKPFLNEDQGMNDVEKNGALNKISIKSKSLKATLKAKYLIYKLEKSFYNKKFIL